MALRAPTTASLRDTFRIPATSPSLVKSLSRLSRKSLIDLALLWLDEGNLHKHYVHLLEDQDDDNDEGDAYEIAESIETLREIYEEFYEVKGGKREIVDRILEADWRDGVTLWQLATVDLRNLDDHPTVLRWTALELLRVQLKNGNEEMPVPTKALAIPQFQVSTFIQNLQSSIAPLVKAHYYVSRSQELPLTIVRIFVTDSPYQTPKTPATSFTDASRTLYIAFPDSSPFVYISATSSGGSGTSRSGTDIRFLKRTVLEAIPKAFSRPHERYALQVLSLAAKSLPALYRVRGSGRGDGNSANGAFSIFADGVVESTPLDPVTHAMRPKRDAKPEDIPVEDKENQKPASNSSSLKRPRDRSAAPKQEDATLLKRRKLAAAKRFGTSARDPNDGKGLDRLEVHIQDNPFKSSSRARQHQPVEEASATDAPVGGVRGRPRAGLLDSFEPSDASTSSTTLTATLSFTGTHVFAGLRLLAEKGIIDAEKMPSWLTGEDGVSVGVVRGGNVVVRKEGSGIVGQQQLNSAGGR